MSRISHRLYSKTWIPEEVMRKITADPSSKASMLLSHVKRKLENKPDAIYEFLEILEEDSFFDDAREGIKALLKCK